MFHTYCEVSNLMYRYVAAIVSEKCIFVLLAGLLINRGRLRMGKEVDRNTQGFVFTHI